MQGVPARFLPGMVHKWTLPSSSSQTYVRWLQSQQTLGEKNLVDLTGPTSSCKIWEVVYCVKNLWGRGLSSPKQGTLQRGLGSPAFASVRMMGVVVIRAAGIHQQGLGWEAVD